MILLAEPHTPGVVRFLSDRIDLKKGQTRSVVMLGRTGTFHHREYGTFDLTREMFSSMIRNFESGVVGREISVDRSHRFADGSCGPIKRLFLDGNKLRGEVEWTPFGVETIRVRGMRYLSMEFHPNWKDNEEQMAHGCTLLGAGLTPRPVLRFQEPVQLSEEDESAGPIYLSERMTRLLTEEHRETMDKYIKALTDKLTALKLSEDMIQKLIEAFKLAAGDSTDEERLKTLSEKFEATGKDVAAAAAAGKGEIRLSIEMPEGGSAQLSEEELNRLLDERDRKREERTTQLAEKKDKNLAAYRTLLSDDEAWGKLDEGTQKKLSEADEQLITADLGEEQVKALAERTLLAAEQISSSMQLAQLGYGRPEGSVRITQDAAHGIQRLAEGFDRRLGLDRIPDAKRYEKTGGVLLAENKALVEEVLEKFDRENGHRLHEEMTAFDRAVKLAGGNSVLPDMNVPAITERTVIREALYDLVGLQFVNSGVAAFNNVVNIPYSYRDTTAAGVSAVRVYERQAIQNAQMIQTMEEARPIPQKLAQSISDELRLLSAARMIDWDAFAENVRNAGRIIGEDTETLLHNELVQASDEFGPVAVTNENHDADTDGAKNVFPLANFPVLHPRSVFDLQGAQVGTTLYPITVTYNAGAISEYDGTGTQAPGNYYTLDYNLGELRIVDETGALQTPGGADTLVVSYTYAANVAKFDTDVPAGDEEGVHWDRFLQAVHGRKVQVEDKRFHMATFGLMSGTIHQNATIARQFAANFTKPGDTMTANGNVGRIKDIPFFKAPAPGLWAADQRVLVGERGITRYRVLKPWSMGMLENERDSTGKFIGAKSNYGDQWIAIHTPTQLKRAYTTIVLYSATGRVLRAE